jgi:hypothetical protein
MPWEEAKSALSSSLDIFGVQTELLALHRQGTGAGEKVCKVKHPSHRCGLAGHYFSPSSRVAESCYVIWPGSLPQSYFCKVLEKLSLSGLEGSHLVP